MMMIMMMVMMMMIMNDDRFPKKVPFPLSVLKVKDALYEKQARCSRETRHALGLTRKNMTIHAQLHIPHFNYYQFLSFSQ